MKLGFIGCGNMAQAMITGILTQKVVSPQELIVSNPREEKTAKLKDEFGIITTTDNKEVAKQSDILVLSVKPQVYPAVIKEIRDEVSSEQIIVTIAAGVSMEAAERQFGKIVRVMPNTPALVGEGMSGLCCNEYVTEEEFDRVHKIFESFGKAEKITENLMDAVVGVSGSGPAYVYMFIEAMADAAVAQGLPRKQAYTFAAQTLLGSAKMVLETGQHPGELKDAVCSPAGTTIEAVNVLEKKGMRSLIIDLRDNGGGLLNTCTQMVSRVIDKDKLIVYTKDKEGNKEEFKSDSGKTLDIPIIILVNGNTASASEIMTGCLKDYGKATVVGTTTYGKGIVQNIMPLTDGSAIKFTIAKYYTPNGTDIHKKGIKPDVKVKMSDAQWKKAQTDEKADKQLKKAIELLEK